MFTQSVVLEAAYTIFQDLNCIAMAVICIPTISFLGVRLIYIELLASHDPLVHSALQIHRFTDGSYVDR